MTLKGLIDHIIFRNPENTYTVLSLNADDGGDYICVGQLPELDKGESISLEGELKDNPKYGVQFSISSFSILPIDDEKSILKYLSSGAVKGVGPGLAKRITQKFKEDTFRIMEEEPERLSEIKGISMRKAIEIAGAFEARAGSRQAISFLSQYDISPGIGQKIYERYKDQIYNIVRTNPYKLIDDIEGVGFISADRIASSVGISADSEYRIRSAVIYLLAETARSGSMCMEERELVNKASELLGLDEVLIENQMDSLSIERKIIRENIEERIFVYFLLTEFIVD